MYHVRKETLSYHKARPLFQKQTKLASVPVKKIVEGLNQYMATSPGHAVVEDHAISFYFMNHVFSGLQQKYGLTDALPNEAQELAEDYISNASLAGIRLFYYTLLVITRESRHLKNPSDIAAHLDPIVGKGYMKFRNALPGSPDSAAQHFKVSPPDMPLMDYCSAVTYVFNHGSFSGGYGGKPWGNIANNAKRLAAGEISMEAFIDTAWTLAHNNGPMFNKGMLYHHHHEDLIKILDVQAAGMVPQMLCEVANKKYGIHGVGDAHIKNWNKAATLLGNPMMGHVNWAAVEAAGKKKYPDEKKMQEKWYGKPAKFTATESAPQGDIFQINEHESVMVVQKQRKVA